MLPGGVAMSTLSDRWRNTSTVFRVLLLVLLVVLLVLLCLLVFLQFGLPLIRPSAETTTTPVPTTITPAGTAPSTEVPPTDTPVPPTNTPVVTTGPPGAITETPDVTPETPAVTIEAPVVVTETPVAEAETVPATKVAPSHLVTPTQAVSPVIKIRDVVRNGSFEAGFQPNELGYHWKGFNNGNADFSYHIDDWPLVVPEGEHAQLIEIKNAQEPDRYFGIYQTVHVIPKKDYAFSMQGLVRTNTGNVEETSYGYRLEVGFDLDGARNWEKVDNWVELPWDEQLRVQDSFRFDVYSTTLTAKTDQITIFIRAWKKWADSGEGNYDVDDIQLVGPVLVKPPSPMIPLTGDAPTIWSDIRVWATVALLLLLVAGALWRFGWKKM
jgi:hypothetical protein